MRLSLLLFFFLPVSLWLRIPCRVSFFPAALRLFLNIYLSVSPILRGRSHEDRGVLPLLAGDATPSVFSLTQEGIRNPCPSSCAVVTVQLRVFVVRCQISYGVWRCICAWLKRHRAFSGPNSQLCPAYGNRGIQATDKDICATGYLWTSQTSALLLSTSLTLFFLKSPTHRLPCSAQVETGIAFDKESSPNPNRCVWHWLCTTSSLWMSIKTSSPSPHACICWDTTGYN